MNEIPEAVYPQAAAIPYRIEDHAPRVLLITSRKHKHWIVPKGIVEDWQSPRQAAQEEAYEEAGIRGTLEDEPVGEYEYEKWGGTCRVELFLLRVEEELPDWPESDFRERRWVGVEEAQDLVDNNDLCLLIKRAAGRMERRGFEGRETS